MTAHGMTRSKVLVEILRKSAVFIRYADIQLLYDFWALQEAELSEESPVELAEGKPSICIYDNDDFVCDTLYNEPKGVHITNVMYVQPEYYYEKEANQVKPTVIKKKEVTQKLKQKCENLTNVDQYSCPAGLAIIQEQIKDFKTLVVRDTMHCFIAFSNISTCIDHYYSL